MCSYLSTCMPAPFRDIPPAQCSIPGARAASAAIPASADSDTAAGAPSYAVAVSLPAISAATATAIATATDATVALDGTAAGGSAMHIPVHIPVQQTAAGSDPAGKGGAKKAATEVAEAAGIELMDASINGSGEQSPRAIIVQPMLAVASSLWHLLLWHIMKCNNNNNNALRSSRAGP